MKTKDNLRKHIFQKRKSLLEKERLDAEKSLFQLWNSIKELYKINKVALYWSINGEISTRSLISYFLEEGSECFLPVISEDKENKTLEFALLEDILLQCRMNVGAGR